MCLDLPAQTTTATVAKTQIVAPSTGFYASTFNAGLLVVFAVVFCCSFNVGFQKEEDHTSRFGGRDASFVGSVYSNKCGKCKN